MATSRDSGTWLGASALRGEFEQGNTVIDIERVGLDAGLNLPRGFSVLAEVAIGENDGVSTHHYFAELGWYSRSESLFLYGQWRYADLRDSGIEDNQQVGLGVRYEPVLAWAASMEFRQLTDAAPNAVRKLSTVMQFRYRF